MTFRAELLDTLASHAPRDFEAQALVIALRSATGEGGRGGQFAALSQAFIESRFDHLALQSATAVRGDRAIGETGQQTALDRPSRAPRRNSAIRHRKIAEHPGHGTDRAPHIHFRGG